MVVTEAGSCKDYSPGFPQLSPPTGSRSQSLDIDQQLRSSVVLLAGEVVTGGKQDRVIGVDRIVPAEIWPIDLSVFCVERAAGWPRPTFRQHEGANGSAQRTYAGHGHCAASNSVWEHGASAVWRNGHGSSAGSAGIGGTSYAKAMQNPTWRRKSPRLL